MPSARSAPVAARKVLVCFDYEGRWGMPFPGKYDIARATEGVLECLARHGVNATFFVVGSLAVDHPRLMSTIAGEGHELAVHGWRHEHLERLDATELERLSLGLAESEAALQSASGKYPAGFRAPFLLAPHFFLPRVYELLQRHGYRWVSNREIRHGVELLRPDRAKGERPWRFVESHPLWLRAVASKALLLALNPALLGRDRVLGSRRATIEWVAAGLRPFFRGSMLELPLYTPLDCDLLGFPHPSVATPQPQLAFAEFALRHTLARATPVTMLTFHDWIIAGGNRLSLLDRVLSSLGELSLCATTVERSWEELHTLAATSSRVRAQGWRGSSRISEETGSLLTQPSAGRSVECGSPRPTRDDRSSTA
jgi:peptidoglycan/xylan/chitin deacetylase (PgdA/CDA1 family)